MKKLRYKFRSRALKVAAASVACAVISLQPSGHVNSSVDTRASDTVETASRYGLEIPFQVGDLQKPRLGSEFSRLFRRVNDLSPDNVSKYVEARPTEYLALIRYIDRLSAESYILPTTADTLKNASTQGLSARFKRKTRPQSLPLRFNNDAGTSVISTTYVSDFADKELKAEEPAKPSTPELDYALKVFKAAMNGQDVEKLALSDAKTLAKDRIEDEAESALSRTFKNAKVDIVGIENSKPEFEVGFVASVAETENTTTFQQTTVNAYDGRTTLNLGVGHRIMSDDRRWMTGFNAFYDHEFPYDHQRGSLGLELISKPLSLTGNYYRGISGYKADKDGQEQKPIDGYDAKLSVALPYVPGVKASFETSKWIGEDGVDDLTRETYGLAGQLSKNLSILYEKAVFSNDRGDDHSVRLSYQWSPSHYTAPTIFDLSPEAWSFDSIESERYSFVDRENRIIKQGQASITLRGK